ncbi:MAG: phytanoyl-CoA dioxygenase family protein [Chitinophagales bacterium]|nr:phytanoyl-CoA dioxygenase family protein [Chitinophagales bacterium]
MLTPLLKTGKLQQDFEENGYVVVPLLDLTEVELLQKIFNKHLGGHAIDSFTSTNIINSKEWRIQVADEIKQILDSKLNAVFENTKFWNPAFLIKPTGQNTEFKLHQDWTFVDESNYFSGNIWIPLADTNEANGTICVIPKSHYKHVKTLRSHTIPEIFRGREDVIKHLSIPVNLKAGEAIIFQHSLVHYSPSNTTDKVRVAVSCGFNSRGATLLNYYKNSDTEVTLYAMPDNFVFDYGSVRDINGVPQNGIILSKSGYKPNPQLSDRELQSFFGSR